MSPRVVPARSEYRALLRRPGYPGFVLTVTLSRITSSMFITTGVLLVLAQTHSPALAGATAAASTITWALSAPLLGAWLDVAHRRRLLIVIDQLLSLLTLVAIVLLAGHAPGWTLPADAVLMSVTRPFSVGSFFSVLAELAGPELLDRASAVEATSMNLSFVVGPAVAGAAAGAVGAGAAIYAQAALTAVVAMLIAINPVFEVRPLERPEGAREALREGIRGLLGEPILVRTGIASMLAMFGWGLMAVGFPLYAARILHAGAHAGGYLWAGIGLGSAIGTFALAGRVSLRRIAGSYAALGLSALLWPLAASLAAGVALVTLTGFLEGPAYSGTIELRQRYTPPAVRAGVMSTLNSFTLMSNSAGAGLAGLLGRPVLLVLAFLLVNLVAAAIAGGPGAAWRSSATRRSSERA
jgi:predicted MFS family arabinose efflux permease